jgi:GNAT superfamily N-acetyltransferase
MHFDADYREQVTLRDGRVVVLRLVRPEDKELLRSGFERWSPESRYRRFFSVKTELSDDELRYLTELDGVRHFALGAVTAAGDDGLGIARYICLADEPGVAEAAIAVADHAQGVGLGSLLFQRLVAAAAERGVERFRCEMLAANASMAELVRSLAPTVSIEIASGVMRMEFTLPNVGPTHPPRRAAARQRPVPAPGAGREGRDRAGRALAGLGRAPDPGAPRPRGPDAAPARGGRDRGRRQRRRVTARPRPRRGAATRARSAPSTARGA